MVCDKVPVHKDDAQRFQDKSEVVKLWERLEAYIRLKKPAYVAKNWKDPRRKNQENRKKIVEKSMQNINVSIFIVPGKASLMGGELNY